MAATTAGLILASTQVAQAGVRAYSAYSEGRYGAAMDKVSARRSMLEAQDAIQRGDIEASERRVAARQLAGRQRAVAAAQGVGVDSGSAGEIVTETGTIGALDAATIKANAFRRAFGLQTEASDLQRRAKMRMQGAKFSAAQNLLTGGMGAWHAINTNLKDDEDKSKPKPKFTDYNWPFRGY
jgi:hypothetical protein